MQITIEFNEYQTLEELQREEAFLKKESDRALRELADQNKKTMMEALYFPTKSGLKNKIKNYFRKRKNQVHISEDMIHASEKRDQENLKLHEKKHQTWLMIENRLLAVRIAIDKHLEGEVKNAN